MQPPYGPSCRARSERGAGSSSLLRWGWLGLCLTGCATGLIEKEGAAPWQLPASSAAPGQEQTADEEGQGDEVAAAASGDALKLPRAMLHKLTVEQYRNSVADLLELDIAFPLDLEPDTAQNGFYAIGAGTATISPAAAEKLSTAAYKLAEAAFAPDHRAQLTPCTPKNAQDSSCARVLVSKLGRRAFRRPLTDEELTRYVDLATQAADKLQDFYAGMELAVAALIQSPNFLFRAELGEPDPSTPERMRYTDYELASRLSYALWNTTPDDALLTAADSGDLRSAQLQAQVERLLDDPQANLALDNFHHERLGLDELEGLEDSSGMDDTLRSALRDDVLRTFAEHSDAGDADILAVFDTRVAFINTSLGELYGMTTDASELKRVELPADGPRRGLLGKPGLLALTSHPSQTSPTLRGKYIRERLLCQSIPAPPPNVVTDLGEPDPNAPTMRDRLLVHATDPSCSGCHALMDPLGLALEHFDALGRYRETDNGAKLDTTGELEGEAFDGALELGALLRDHPRVAECFVRQVYRYSLGHVETAGQKSQIQMLAAQFERAGYDLRALFKMFVQSDTFLYAAKEAP